MTPAATGRRLSSLDAAKDLPLRLSQSRAVEPAARTRSAAEYRADVADRRLAPDFKTIADFRRTMARRSGRCVPSLWCCAASWPVTRAVFAIDGSKFKAVNNRDKNYTVAKVTGRREQVDASIARYLRALDQADREESDIAEAKSSRLKEKIAGLRRQMQALKVMEQTVQDATDSRSR